MFKDMFKNFLNYIHNTKETNKHYKKLLETSTTFQNLFDIPENTNNPSYHRVNTITLECPDINKEKASVISNLIPIEETFILVTYAKEIKTNTEYFLILTNKYIWTINKNTYGAYNYNTIDCKIVKNTKLTKIILLNNVLLEINGNNKINTLITLLTNNEEREQIIKERTNYLCGITPIYQQINNIYSGISIDKDNNIVFHTKDNNYKHNMKEISHYEILLDNSVIISTNNNIKLTNFQTSCYKISIKIILKNETVINMPILEPNSLNTKYQRHDTIFQKNFDFAKELISKLSSLIPK